MQCNRLMAMVMHRDFLRDNLFPNHLFICMFNLEKSECFCKMKLHFLFNFCCFVEMSDIAILPTLTLRRRISLENYLLPSPINRPIICNN